MDTMNVLAKVIERYARQDGHVAARPGLVGGSAPSNTSNKKKDEPLKEMPRKAVAFWEDVNKEWPHPQIAEWIDLIKDGEVDWFRNAGLALEAVSRNSTNSRGFFSQGAYEKNRQRLDKIVEKHGLAGLMQA